MRGDSILPAAGNLGADGEAFLAAHLKSHNIPFTGFGDVPDGIDGTIGPYPVECKTVSNPTTDRFTIAAPYAHRYNDIDWEPELILAVVHPSWERPRFIPWSVAWEHAEGPYKPTTRSGFGRHDYYTVRMAYTRPCKRCVP